MDCDLTAPRFSGDYYHDGYKVICGGGGLERTVGLAVNPHNAALLVEELRLILDKKLSLEGGQADMFAGSQESA